MKKEKIVVFTATYNEIDNIQRLTDAILKQIPSADILIVDDNSPDGTGRVLDSLSKKNRKINVIHRYKKLGLGSAHKIAMQFALKNNYDILITMDADFSHNPNHLPELLFAMEGKEFVIGSRYMKNGKSDYGFKRMLFSKSANYVAKFLLNIKLHETTTSYRGFRRSILERLDINSIKSDGYSFFVDCIYHVTTITDQYDEFPIHFHDRMLGSSKISSVEVFKGIVTVFRLAIKRLIKIKKRENIFYDHHLMEYVNCNVCKTPYAIELYQSTTRQHLSDMYMCSSTHHQSHGRIVKCLTCGLLYVNPQFPESHISDMYSMIIDQTYVVNLDSRYKTFQYNFSKFIEYIPPKGKLLDIGSYCGIFLKLAKDTGYDVMGLEPSGWAVNYSKENFNVDVINGVLSDIPYSIHDFDIITAWDVLEHFTNPMGELKLINALLKPGGKFVFSTLNIENWLPRVMGERWPWLMDMHLYYYNNSLVEEMLRLNGFKLVKVSKYCHIITFEYLLSKMENMGIWGVRHLRRMIARTPFAKLFFKFSFGDIQLYISEKM